MEIILKQLTKKLILFIALLSASFSSYGINVLTSRTEASTLVDTDILYASNALSTVDWKVPFSILKSVIPHVPEGTAILSTGETGAVKFLREDGDDSSSWQIVGVHNYGSMWDENNTNAFVINDAGGDFHSYHTNELAIGGVTSGWTLDTGGAGTSFPIASIADGADTGVDIAVTTTGDHLLAVGDIISQTNLANAIYVGIFSVKAIISAVIYEVAAAYTATGTGTMDQAAVLIAGADAGGVYNVGWSASATSAVDNETFDYKLYLNADAIVGSSVRKKFGTATDFDAWAAQMPYVTIVTGDKISLAIANQDTAGNLTIRHLNIGLGTE